MVRIKTNLPLDVLGAGCASRPRAGLLVLIALAILSSCLSVASSGNPHQAHQHQHQSHHQHQHENHNQQHQQQHSPAELHENHQQAPNNVAPPPPYQQHQPQQPPPPPPYQQYQPQPQPHQQYAGQQQPHQPDNAVPAAAPTSNNGNSFATGALMGAASTAAAAAATSALMPHHHNHQEQPQAQGPQQNQGLNRQTRHLGAHKAFVDLSHPLHNGTLHWPTFPDIQYSILADGERNNTQGQSYYLKADTLSAAIHSGTHLDAPRHFSKTGWTVDQIPLDRLIDVPLTVIDVSAKVKANRTYNFVKDDFMNANTGEPLVQANSVVLVYTGISQGYDQGKEAYLGTTSANISEMKIPGFSAEAANFMVERGVYGVGLDSLSADSSDKHGLNGLDSFDPVAHVILNLNNVYILENISNKLAELVNVQEARLTIAPLPIVGGSGSQVRLVAMLGHDECHCENQQQESTVRNGDGSHNQYSSLAFLISIFLCVAVFLV